MMLLTQNNFHLSNYTVNKMTGPNLHNRFGPLWLPAFCINHWTIPLFFFIGNLRVPIITFLVAPLAAQYFSAQQAFPSLVRGINPSLGGFKKKHLAKTCT